MARAETEYVVKLNDHLQLATTDRNEAEQYLAAGKPVKARSTGVGA